MKYTELRGKRLAAGILRQDALAGEYGCGIATIADIELGRIGIDEETVNGLNEAVSRLERKGKEEGQCEQGTLASARS